VSQHWAENRNIMLQYSRIHWASYSTILDVARSSWSSSQKWHRISLGCVYPPERYDMNVYTLTTVTRYDMGVSIHQQVWDMRVSIHQEII